MTNYKKKIHSRYIVTISNVMFKTPSLLSYLATYHSLHFTEATEVTTDTVCVLGIVNVKIVGSVQSGERIYASNEYPGKAVPQSHLLHGVGERHEVLLGM